MTTLFLLALAVDGSAWLDSQPLRFEQSPGRHRFVARGRGYAIGLGATSHELVLGERRVRISLAAARVAAPMAGEGALAVRTTYFRGVTQAAALRNYPRVRSTGVYPGIDMVFHGRGGLLEYDFVVAPGADPGQIAFDVDGATPILNAEGDLVVAEGVRWKRPEVYQEKDGARRVIESRYVVKGHHVRFALAEYDHRQELIIDPVLAFSSLIGKAANEGLRGIAADGAGNIYVAGTALSADLPVTAGMPFAGRQGNPVIPIGDAFVAKFSPAGALLYLTYLGGDWEDCALGLAVDRAGNAYITGFTTSPNFPTTTGALQTRNGGLGGSLLIRFGDAFITKLNPAGDQILYSTLLGGARDDAGTSIAIDAAGNAYIAGVTQSVNFPVTDGAPQRRLAGIGGQPSFPRYGMALLQTGDAFVAKLNPAGSALVWSTYLGGPQDDLATSIAVDAASNVYVAGSTLSTDFPTTGGAYQRQYRGFDGDNIFFQFGDGFITKFNAAGTALLYSTFLGGRGDDAILGLTVDAGGNAYVAGVTSTRDLPTTANAYQRTYQGPRTLDFDIDQLLGDGFVAKLNPAGSGLVFLTYLGAETDDGATAIALDPAGNIYVTGFTQSPGFPVTADASQARLGQPRGAGGGGDGFLVVLDPNATRLTFGTFIGGNRDDVALGVAVDAAGNAYVAGMATSPNLAGTPRVFQTALGGAADGFVARFSGFGAAANAPVLRSVLNGASNAAGVVSPGMIFVGYGDLLGPTTLLGAALDANGRLATNRSDVVMRFDGSPAPVVYVSAGQVSGVVPYNVAGKQTVQLTLEYQGRVSAPLTLRVADTVPALFSANSSGTGAAAALNQDGTFNSVTPAAPESVVVLFGTGEGRTDPAVADGTVVAAIVRPVVPVTATMGGRAAEVLYAGSAPGNVAGLFQVNVKLPPGVSGNVPVVVTVGGVASQAGLTVAVR